MSRKILSGIKNLESKLERCQHQYVDIYGEVLLPASKLFVDHLKWIHKRDNPRAAFDEWLTEVNFVDEGWGPVYTGRRSDAAAFNRLTFLMVSGEVDPSGEPRRLINFELLDGGSQMFFKEGLSGLQKY